MLTSIDELTNIIEINLKFSSSYKTTRKRENSNFSLMKMNNTLTIKQRPKQKHHIEVNYQTEKHYSKHIESNTPAV